jgi:Zn finger protein HypA/HybF involved in hydrogenase expression
MAYCTKCGEKISEEAYFCPKCGTKTQKGIEANVSNSADEMREAFQKLGAEMEKAFLLVAKEAHTAFQKAKDNVQKSTAPQQVTCSNCQAQIPSSAVYCPKCGTKQA